MANIYNTFMKELAMNKQPHKHAAIIKAWADGAIIQFQGIAGEWEDVLSNSPLWSSQNSYRIKPEEKPKKSIRLALFRDSTGTYPSIAGYTAGFSEKDAEVHPEFVRWLTDTIEYEAE